MLIGITGTDGAGKSTVVEYLVRYHGYIHFSARGYLAEQLRTRDLVADRPSMRQLANELRAEHGNDMIVTAALSKCTKDGLKYLIIDSIRTLAEVETLKSNGGVLLVVDADTHVRYERITRRGSKTDTVTFDQFIAQEKQESNDSDPHGMQKMPVMALADHTIMNNGTVAELEALIEEAYTKLKG